MDERLRGRAAAATLAHRNDPRPRAMLEYRDIDQVIDQHHICLAQGTYRLQREQLRITRARTYQPDFCTHSVFLTRRR
ncbi:hypothetical protein D3C79_1001330 [compost metagenome]